MAMDPIELEYTLWGHQNLHNVLLDEYITTIKPTTQWTQMRDNLVVQMYNHWLANGQGGREGNVLGPFVFVVI